MVGQRLRTGGEGERCGQECLQCDGEKGRKCRHHSVVYHIWCRKCAAEVVKSIYILKNAS